MALKGNFTNTKKQGDAGLGVAIAFFCQQGFTVMVPLTDSQDYDLVVDSENGLQKVQVKTTTEISPSGSYVVDLRLSGGNSKKNSIHKYANEIHYDLLFVLVDNGSRYLIPKIDIAHIRNSIKLGKLYESYQV